MGTSWQVTYLPPAGAAVERSQLQQSLEQQLEAVNDSMSTWRSDSEISRFNHSEPGDWVELSAGFTEVMQTALMIGAASGGAYDVTVSPLVDLWGFGAGSDEVLRRDLPSAAEIASRLERVGQQYLELDVAASRLRKQRDVALDLSSIAKGYAVDLLAQELLSQQIDNFLVEVGGEIRVAGHSPRGDAWRVAIERPGTGTRSPARALAVTDKAVATSGDYRNFFEVDGRRYSHSIDPRTGSPVTHDLVSVTVIADDCTSADGWATALEVLGEEAALELAEEQGLAVYLMRRTSDGIVSSHSSAFSPWLDSGTQGGN
ncbi:FAD:protein FMN transferase [Kineobactrum salinum]|uniref:FAD:protein FMN transferase n=2 Tax=Kineobactrum salinum TaxID=2708301 RepID=A0A6C0UAE3_9GAMM|nr:FAD:protein FMN transferase [Kineobactrum salinum]